MHGCNFHCSFEGAISKKKLLQACAETFRRWAKDATFANGEHHLVKVQPKASANGNAAAEGGKKSVSVSSADVVCPACGKTYNGTRGLASDGRSCPGQAGAAEADKSRRQKTRRAANAVATSRLQARILLPEKKRPGRTCARELSLQICSGICSRITYIHT